MNPQSDEETFVGLLAVVWDSLERIGERFESTRESDSSGRLNTIRVDLILWKQAARHFARRTDLSESYRTRLQWLLSRAEEILDAGLHGTAEQLGSSIGQAQDCLFDEAGGFCGRFGGGRTGEAIAVMLHIAAERSHAFRQS
jgi:hypothetical protein